MFGLGDFVEAITPEVYCKGRIIRMYRRDNQWMYQLDTHKGYLFLKEELNLL